MSEYKAIVSWGRGPNEEYVDQKYSRAHSWEFEGGITVPATASHHIVPVPYSNPDYVDPEQAFVASLSSCHMLFFLDLCALRGYIIDEYIDEAVGVLEKNSEGKLAMTLVTLSPKVKFSGNKIPDEKKQEKLHHRAHDLCFIANSAKTEVVVDL